MPIKDKTGERHGKLTIVSLSERIDGKVAWNCKCDCGNEKKVKTHYLIPSKSRIQSCGCLRKERKPWYKRGKLGPRKDKTGMRFGRLTVLSLSERIKGKIAWNCKCDCGKEVKIQSRCLVSDRVGTRSCGCLMKQKKPWLRKNRPRRGVRLGNEYGKVIVVDKETDPKYIVPGSKATWYCMCNCGQFVRFTTDQLLTMKNPNCGCVKDQAIRSMRVDLTGQRFGMLTAVEYLGNSIWYTECDCGESRNALTSALRSGQTVSCGCADRRKRKNKVKI